MKIGIDIDGTLTNIVDSVIAYGQEYELENNLDNGIKNPVSDQVQITFEWGTEIGQKFWNENFQRINQVEPRPLTKKYLDKLREEGHQIIIITARTDKELKNVEKASVKWLKKHKIPFDKIVTAASDKGKICKENNVEVFIDDLPRNCDSTSSQGVKTFVMHGVTNENYNREGVERVYSFVDFYRHIKKMSEGEDGPKTYVLNVNKKYFKKLKNGTKKIELRLNDLRRQKIKSNDYLKLRMDGNHRKFFYAKVVKVNHYKDFIELLEQEGLERCGFANKTMEQANVIMHRFYSEEEIQKFGVIAIEFKKQ